jgi:hypothetical protein
MNPIANDDLAAASQQDRSQGRGIDRDHRQVCPLVATHALCLGMASIRRNDYHGARPVYDMPVREDHDAHAEIRETGQVYLLAEHRNTSYDPLL